MSSLRLVEMSMRTKEVSIDGGIVGLKSKENKMALKICVEDLQLRFAKQ